jgi:hypoxia up-regulated 1
MITKGILLVVGLICLASTAIGIAVMSVDVGSEWMKIAVVSPGVPMEIALNPESKRKTNMVVSMKDGERKFGSDAMNVCVKSPKHCFSHLLDLLGKTLDNPIVQLYTARFPHHKLESTERGTIQFRTSEDAVWSVEELMAMMFSHARQQAEAYTEQKIKDVVVTVPAFFNQAERLALIDAVQLSGLSVLQLMSEPMAVALNYGMFRRKEINGTAKNIMLYDMGAQDTTVSIVGYQIVKTKEKGFSETHPQAQILGIGYDRTLGGSDITFRIREYLADQFDALKKGSKSVREVPRAMGKLLKEAERVKLIMSANTDCYAQIENVMEDIDFKVPFSREKLEELMAHIWDRVTVPVVNALESANMPLTGIDQVILVGGGSRVPKVQELLTKFINMELGKNLNTDESAAMGAVYKAADLSSGFKVKKFITKEAVLLPIDVNFERALDPSEEGYGEGGTKKVRRTLFSKMNPYPQKKIMTFNKHVKDFMFYVNYNDLEYLGAEEVARIGSLNISSVLVKGVAEALENNTAENLETKGVKAHFTLDDSGILSLSSVESVFEKTISVEEQEALEVEKEAAEAKEDTWSKLGDTISQFFKPEEEDDSADKDKDKTGKKDEKKKAEKKDTDKKKDKKKEPKKPALRQGRRRRRHH